MSPGDRRSLDAGFTLLDDFRHLLRVEKIFKRYCDEGKRPTRQEAEEWLISEGWNETGRANLLKKWGYSENG
jgi:hypothetical protein